MAIERKYKPKEQAAGVVTVEIAQPAVAELPEGGQPTRQLIAGMVPPPGFENPPRGEPSHRCLDSAGRYQPTWSCVYISRSREMPERQYFLDENAQPIHVTTDMWVDVPPSVVNALRSCRESRITRGTLTNEGLTKALAEVATNHVPRFQYSVVPSA